MQKHPPRDHLYVTKDIYLHADKQKSSIQGFYTSGLSNCQAFAMWNDKGFFLTHIGGGKGDFSNFKCIIEQLVSQFKNIYGEPSVYGHGFSGRTGVHTRVFEAALQDCGIKPVYSIDSSSVIIDRKEMKASQKFYPGYFFFGKAEVIKEQGSDLPTKLVSQMIKN